MVGNAVPVNLAFVLAKAIMEQLKNNASVGSILSNAYLTPIEA